MASTGVVANSPSRPIYAQGCVSLYVTSKQKTDSGRQYDRGWLIATSLNVIDPTRVRFRRHLRHGICALTNGALGFERSLASRYHRRCPCGPCCASLLGRRHLRCRDIRADFRTGHLLSVSYYRPEDALPVAPLAVPRRLRHSENTEANFAVRRDSVTTTTATCAHHGLCFASSFAS